MRTNWNFSHTVTPRSEAFGRVDSATTSNAPDYSERAKALRMAKARREEAEKPLPSGGTVRMW